jgi:hypothetical protein
VYKNSTCTSNPDYDPTCHTTSTSCAPKLLCKTSKKVLGKTEV